MNVGENSKLYGVHKDLLCACSSNFAAALNGNFKEGKTQSIAVPDVSEHIFEAFLDWLYGRSTICELKRSQLIDTFVFADAYLIPQLKRAVTDEWIDYWGNFAPHYEHVIQAFTTLPASSALCRLLLDLNLEHFETRDDQNENTRQLRNQLPQEFLLQMYVG